MKIYKIFITLIVLITSQIGNANTNARLHNLTKIFIEQKIDTNLTVVEGFTQKISGEKINYHSPLPQNMDALISRATDGTMQITWKSGNVTASENIQLIWFAGLGVNLGEAHFDMTINGEHILTFASVPGTEWKVEGKYGAVLTFKTGFKDAVGDLFGVMVLTLHNSKKWNNHSVEISVTGRPENSNAWYMTFCNDRVAESLLKTKQSGFWYRMRHKPDTGKILLELPHNWAGRSVQIASNSSPSLYPKVSNNLSFVEFPDSMLASYPVDLFIDNQLMDQIEHVKDEQAPDDLYDDGKYVYRTFAATGNENILEVSAGYLPGFLDDILNLSRSAFADANLELITSSHQDIAWMDDPLACKIKRDTSILTPAIELLRNDPQYHYSAEQALMLYEYLNLHPQALPEIQKYSARGRLEWGASFNQPYEGMYYGESLIRQFYLGRKWLKKTLPGYDPKVYFNIDVPGRTRQMPQIAKKCGVDYMIISRHGKGYFFWRSPDGSQVGIHSPGHYHQASEFLRQSVQSAIMRTPEQIDERKVDFIKYQLPRQIPFLLSSDMSRPRDLRPLFQTWENISIISSTTHESVKLTLPQWRYNTFQPVLQELFTKGKTLPVLEGERPNVWLYIHGPSHHWAISASREGGRMLPVAETFNTIAAVLNKDWSLYPQNELTDAWQAQIYPDHGWGGHDGHITDAFFREKSEFSRDEAKRLIRKAIKDISSFVKIDHQKGRALIVFNPLSRERDTLLETTLKFKSGGIKNLYLSDAKGRKIPAELDEKEYDSDGYLRSVRVKAILKKLPAVGYTTLYIKNKLKNEQNVTIKPAEITNYENQFYRITFANGGIEQIFDKSLNRNLARTDKFLFGELFALKSEGNGAGEFDAPQMPTTEYFEKTSQYKPKWKHIGNSSISQIFELKQKLNNTNAVIRVVVFDNIKRIDFKVDLLDWDGTKSLEYRLAFPLNQDGGKVSYEVPFAKVTVGEDEIPGAAGERYQQLAKACNMPLPATQIKEISKMANLPEAFSFFNISEQNVVLSTIKKAEDSNDVIVRIYEAEGNDSKVEMNWFNGIFHLQKTNLIEEEHADPGLLKNGIVNIGKYAIETFKNVRGCELFK